MLVVYNLLLGIIFCVGMKNKIIDLYKTKLRNYRSENKLAGLKKMSYICFVSMFTKF
jgi:hypothetical protein